MLIQEITARSILNPTGGFLSPGFTHTINLYRGCALGNTLCGLYCYAQWNPYHTQGRAWGTFLDAKTGVVEAYQVQYDRLKRSGKGKPKPLRIFMSSVTEPYPPQERTTRQTRGLLEAMIDRPPDLLVIQSHTPLMTEDITILEQLHQRCRLHLHITVETDILALPPPFPKQAYSPASRIAALKTLKTAGLTTVATVSPLLPLEDPHSFARTLADACHRVVLDHYLLGDGSSEGQRTNKTSLPAWLDAAGYGEWRSLDKFYKVVQIFRDIFGKPSLVGVSQAGFNAIHTDTDENRNY